LVAEFYDGEFLFVLQFEDRGEDFFVGLCHCCSVLEVWRWDATGDFKCKQRGSAASLRLDFTESGGEIEDAGKPSE
jgi:hypothetical protein